MEDTTDAPNQLARLDTTLRGLPARPGCYIFKDEAGKIIYVGKAVSLRSRVRSYFQKSAFHSSRIQRMVAAVHDLDTIVVASELEALVLECNLIKKHQPRYNVRLRDDKQYPYLCVTMSEPFPRLLLTRRVRTDGNRYFGPYSGSRAVYSTMDIIKRLFPIVSCGKPFTGEAVRKPCLYFHMGQCLAPCAGLADRVAYRAAVEDVLEFLSGRQERLLRDLKRNMGEAAEMLQFERAARLRDQISALEELMARQKVVANQDVDQDVIAVAAGEGGQCVQMFYIRGGKLVGQNSFVLEGADEDENPAESVQEFIKQFYQSAPFVPREVLLPCDFEEMHIVEEWLRQRKGSKVELLAPERGPRRRLVEMATENATLAVMQMKAQMQARLDNRGRALDDLAEALGLPQAPRRIECYDISNFQGDHFVGSMVVCANGEMDRSQYRRFKIKEHNNHPDDVAMIREVVTRRLKEATSGNERFLPLPDLIIMDGGRGQLNSGLAALEETGTSLPICGLAKRFEHIILPLEPDPVVLPRTSQALYLVQRIRDEAHRFANAYRVTLQSRKQTQSTLDAIPGIGPTRRKALLRHFGSIEKMRVATLDDLAAAPKMNRTAAASVYGWLQGSG